MKFLKPYGVIHVSFITISFETLWDVSSSSSWSRPTIGKFLPFSPATQAIFIMRCWFEHHQLLWTFYAHQMLHPFQGCCAHLSDYPKKHIWNGKNEIRFYSSHTFNFQLRYIKSFEIKVSKIFQYFFSLFKL